MATLIIRNLHDGVRDRLRERAARRGVSMEEEVRSILAASISSGAQNASRGFGSDLHAVFAPVGGIDLPAFPDEPVKDLSTLFEDDNEQDEGGTS